MKKQTRNEGPKEQKIRDDAKRWFVDMQSEGFRAGIVSSDGRIVTGLLMIQSKVSQKS